MKLVGSFFVAGSGRDLSKYVMRIFGSNVDHLPWTGSTTVLPSFLRHASQYARAYDQTTQEAESLAPCSRSPRRGRRISTRLAMAKLFYAWLTVRCDVVRRWSSNRSMKPASSLRNKFSVCLR